MHAAARREIESLREEHETLAMQHVLAHTRANLLALGKYGDDAALAPAALEISASVSAAGSANAAPAARALTFEYTDAQGALISRTAVGSVSPREGPCAGGTPLALREGGVDTRLADRLLCAQRRGTCSRPRSASSAARLVHSPSLACAASVLAFVAEDAASDAFAEGTNSSDDGDDEIALFVGENPKVFAPVALRATWLSSTLVAHAIDEPLLDGSDDTATAAVAKQPLAPRAARRPPRARAAERGGDRARRPVADRARGVAAARSHGRRRRAAAARPGLRRRRRVDAVTLLAHRHRRLLAVGGPRASPPPTCGRQAVRAAAAPPPAASLKAAAVAAHAVCFEFTDE